MKNINPELIAKARATKSVEELLELAKANNIELTDEEAKTYFAQLNANGAVSDDELDIVSGGKEEDEKGCDDDFTFLFLEEGTLVTVINGERCSNCNGVRGVVTKRQQSCDISMTQTHCSVLCTKCKTVIIGQLKEGNVTIG